MRRQIYNRYNAENESGEINISPLIDMVFILLIFFIVTTSFVKETGISVEKTQASSAEELPEQSILIAISANGEIYMGGEKLNLVSVRFLVRDEILANPDKPVIVIADRNSKNATLIDVIDECELAGAKFINLASESE